MDKAITVASRNPALYGIDQKELDSRRRWTSNARDQVSAVTFKEIGHPFSFSFRVKIFGLLLKINFC